ncbi:MAG: hypothetical protein L6R39_003840, partial [Caloplaca ligustica]
MVVTIIILAIAASNAADFTGISCSVPSKLGYNVAAAVLSFIVLLVLLLSTGPKAALRVIPWFIWGQLGLDVFMFIIWIAAAGVSQYNCNDLCNACSGYSEVWASGLDCYCGGGYYWYKRDQSPAPAGLARSLQERAYRGSKPGAGKVAGKTALNSIMVVLWAFTTAMTIFWIFKNRRAGAAASTGPAAPTTGPAAPQQAGGPGAVPTTEFYPEKTEEPYTNQPLQQGNYPPQPQPPMQSYSPQAQQPMQSYPPQSQPPMQQQPMQAYPDPISNMQPNTYATSRPQGPQGEHYTQPSPLQTSYPHNHAEMGSMEPPREQT